MPDPSRLDFGDDDETVPWDCDNQVPECDDEDDDE